MASTSPLRPIAITRSMRSPQPIHLTIDGRPGNVLARQRSAFAVSHAHSSPLVMRLFERVAGFGQHLAALGGRHEIAVPTVALDVRHRLRRSPVAEGATESRVARWPWGFSPSVSIPMRHEQFVGRAVLPESASLAESVFAWGPSEDSADVGFASALPSVESVEARPVLAPGLAGARPLVRRASEPELLLSTQHLANRIVADHSALEATAVESRARQIARSEQRALTLQSIALGDVQPQYAIGSPATGSGSLSELYRAHRETSQAAESAPTNFTLELLRHLNWSPTQEQRQGNRLANVSFARPMTTVGGQAGVASGSFSETGGDSAFRTMQVPPVATPLVPNLPQSTVSPPARPLVGRTLDGGAPSGASFAQPGTLLTSSSIVPPFVADRLAQVSRLLSSESVASDVTTASPLAPGASPRASEPLPSLAEAMLPEMPVVAQRIAFGAAQAQRTLAGPASPVWGALGRQIQVEPERMTVTLPPSRQTSSPNSQSSPAVVVRRSSQAQSPASYASELASPGWIPGMSFARSDVSRSAPVAPIHSSPISPMVPLVYRSPLVDQAEPDEMQRAEAGDLMARSTGAPLPTVIRRSMEQRLGMDLASVRVHTGPSVMRAANLIAARSMARGTDVFMPGGVPESQTSPDLPLLAHELTHVAHHQGHQLPTTATAQRSLLVGPRPMPVQPLTLARRTSDQEQQANQIERSFLDAARGLGQSALPESLKNPALTLPKLAQSGLQQAKDLVGSGVQQARDALTDVAAPVTNAVSAITSAIPSAAPGPSAAELADQVYHLLERRLMVERERGGYRR